VSGPVAFVPMKLTPYLQVDDIAFSIGPADLLLRKSSPVATGS
jgi:hypothetical protein